MQDSVLPEHSDWTRGFEGSTAVLGTFWLLGPNARNTVDVSTIHPAALCNSRQTPAHGNTVANPLVPPAEEEKKKKTEKEKKEKERKNQTAHLSFLC